VGFFKKTIARLQEDIRISSSNAGSFDENWSFVSSRFRIISLVTLVLLLFGILFFVFLLYGPTKSYFRTEDVSIERQKLEEQNKRVSELDQKIDQQDAFIKNIQAVLQGKISPDSVNNKPKNIKGVDLTNVNVATTKDEGKLARKVKDDMRTVKKKGNENTKKFFFEAPVRGTISEKFSLDRHPAVDIVCKKESSVKACMDGVIVYGGYSKNDGNFLIIDHGGGYVSVYKHNKVNLKTTGQRVQLGDPIAIVGNSGENSTGPHLHFELWFEQRPIDPETIMSF
jgi:murein DD-endopeptidase MepM/ murein hydrolase activator NlpD